MINTVLKSSQIIGLSDEHQWSQTKVFDNILITLEVESDGTFSATDEGDKFLAGIAFILREKKPQDKEAFTGVINQFLLTSNLSGSLKSLVVGMVVGTEIYIFCKGKGSAILKRGDLWSPILVDEGLVCGKIETQDLIVCSTATFNRLLDGETVMNKFIEEKDPFIAGEKLGTILQNLNDSKGAAAVFAVFDNSELQVQVEAEAKVEETPTVTADKNIVVPEIAKKAPFFKFKLPKNIRIPIPNLHIKELLATPKKRVLAVALVLSVFLVGSIVIGLGKLDSQQSGNSQILPELSDKVVEGEGLIDLDNRGARDVLKEAQVTLTSLQEKYKKGTKERIEVENLLQRTDNALKQVLKIYPVDLNVFLDLTVVKEGAIAQRFSLYENNLVTLDNKNVSVILTNAQSLASSIVGGGSKTPQASLIGIHGNNIFVLTSSGIVKIDTASKKQEVIVSDLKEVSQAVDLAGYAGNVYIYDGGTRKIWKFMALDSGYSSAKTYLPDDSTVPMEVVSMAIDGSVWLLGDNQVKKYTRGSEEPFSLEILDQPLIQAKNIYTDDESEFIYLLDGNRVVVYDKSGVYVSQYEWNQTVVITDMVVAQKIKKILLLSQSTIYSIDLK